MGYRYLNKNVLGKFEEDCTVRAISCSTNRSWDYVYEYLSDAAQANGTMMDNREFIIDFLDSRYERVPDIYGTVGEVSKEFQKNVILITMNGHITCSKYGIIYDTFDPRDREAEFVWIVE